MEMSNRQTGEERNEFCLRFPARTENESLARVAAAAFAAQCDPLLDEMEDLKTAVSEAVTNAIIHGYAGQEGEVRLSGVRYGQVLTLTVEDDGCGIADVAEAMRPFFTTRQDQERSGLGFTVMETFTDSVSVESGVGKGTRVILTKKLKNAGGAADDADGRGSGRLE